MLFLAMLPAGEMWSVVTESPRLSRTAAFWTPLIGGSSLVWVGGGGGKGGGEGRGGKEGNGEGEEGRGRGRRGRGRGEGEEGKEMNHVVCNRVQ